MAVLLATLSSVLWGTGDFMGGSLSRRAHPVAVVRAAQALAVIGLVAVAGVTGELGRTGAVGWGIAAGTAGCIGLTAFYSALAAGTMGVVAPIAAVGVIIPVAYGFLRGDEATVTHGLGIAVTILGVVLATGPERRGGRGAATSGRSARPGPDRPEVSPLLLAAVAAAGFGAALLLVAEGGEVSVAMTLLTMRVTTTIICTVALAVVVRGATQPSRRDLPTLALIATTDAAANGLYVVAVGLGQLSISAVAASLYPAVTAVLAWRFHDERLRPLQVTGVVATLIGVALLAAG